MQFGNIRVCGPQDNILDQEFFGAGFSLLYYSRGSSYLEKLRELRPVLSITQQDLTILVYPKDVTIPEGELSGINVKEILYFESFAKANKYVKEKYYKEGESEKEAKDKLKAALKQKRKMRTRK